jgi:hypothetical protein
MFVNGAGCVKGDDRPEGHPGVRIPSVKWCVVLLAAVALLASCGGDDDDAETTTNAIPGGADPEAVEVIDNWATALRAGDVDGAAGHFAIPSVVQNAGPAIEIADAADARAFNASLPCGAVLIFARPLDNLVVATFRLTERPGPGTCGSGVGHRASTAFGIDADGKIAEWRRVVTEGGGGGDGPGVPSTSA